jgi:2,3-bisphosphoglycerate-dependent phosphoglycerate mutase
MAFSGRKDAVVIEIVFETHSWSEDNERGVATGWLPGRLSDRGRLLAGELGLRRRQDGIAAVFASDLTRAAETAQIAFAGSKTPVLHDWRLRECDYGWHNGSPAAQLDKQAHIDNPYPGGESWRQALSRVGGVLSDLKSRWDGQRVLIIGHVATGWALEYYLNQVPLEKLVNNGFEWREGWEYRLG